MIFEKIRDFLMGSSEGEIRDPNGIYFYVKCSRCGAPVRVRADKRMDIRQDYEQGGYIWRKEIMDGRCFQLMQATVHFDAGFRVVEQSIEGGEFITWDDYKALTKPDDATES
jgi:hypothetical protein